MFSRHDAKEGAQADALPDGRVDFGIVLSGYTNSGFARAVPRRRPVAGDASYCSSLMTSCCTLLAWASAEMPVWLRISYLDMADEADA